MSRDAGTILQRAADIMRAHGVDPSELEREIRNSAYYAPEIRDLKLWHFALHYLSRTLGDPRTAPWKMTISAMVEDRDS